MALLLALGGLSLLIILGLIIADAGRAWRKTKSNKEALAEIRAALPEGDPRVRRIEELAKEI
jgi:hypothetical protein